MSYLFICGHNINSHKTGKREKKYSYMTLNKVTHYEKIKKGSVHGRLRMRAGLFCVDQESVPSWMATLPYLFLNEAHKGTHWAEYRVYILIGSMRWLGMMSQSVLLWEDGTDILVVIPWLSQCVLFWAHNPIILKTDKLKKEGKSENQWGTCNTMRG